MSYYSFTPTAYSTLREISVHIKVPSRPSGTVNGHFDEVVQTTEAGLGIQRVLCKEMSDERGRER